MYFKIFFCYLIYFILSFPLPSDKCVNCINDYVRRKIIPFFRKTEIKVSKWDERSRSKVKRKLRTHVQDTSREIPFHVEPVWFLQLWIFLFYRGQMLSTNRITYQHFLIRGVHLMRKQPAETRGISFTTHTETMVIIFPNVIDAVLRYPGTETTCLLTVRSVHWPNQWHFFNCV